MAALGFTIFLIIGLMAFWCLSFLLGFVLPYWITIGSMHMLRPKRLIENANGSEEN